jgi:hypothetical protein
MDVAGDERFGSPSERKIGLPTPTGKIDEF